MGAIVYRVLQAMIKMPDLPSSVWANPESWIFVSNLGRLGWRGSVWKQRDKLGGYGNMCNKIFEKCVLLSKEK